MAINAGPKIVEDGLVLCLDAANRRSYPRTGTVWTDLTANKNNGTLTNMNGSNFSSDGAGSLIFDGTNERVDMITPISISSYPFNVSVVLKRFDTTDYPRLFDISDNTYQFQAVLDIGGNGELKTKHTKWQPNSGGHSTTWGFIPNLNEFEVISVNVYPLINEVSLYRNGINQSGSSSNNVNVGANSNATYLGCRRDFAGFSFMSGQFGCFHIHNRDLSPTEIKQNYLATKGRFQ
tara:strand:+ start:387 stop:1091 length:705 start_codon:yes stop_codon:yes gene_type:complete